MPNPPDNFMLQWFLAVPQHTRTKVLPSIPPKSNLQRRIWTVSGWTLFAVSLIALLVDILDAAEGGYNKSEYGHVNPIISLVSYLGTQMAFSKASIALAFLLIKRNAIIKSTNGLEQLLNCFNYTDSQKMNCQKVTRVLKYLCYFVMTMAFIGLVSVFLVPEFFTTFWRPRILASLCSDIAYISLWFLNSTFSSLNMWTLTRHTLVAVTNLICVYLVVRPPTLLSALEPSAEEESLTLTLFERFQRKGLLFKAGQAIDLGPVAISTLLAGLVTFACIVIDRTETFKNGQGN
ncbi:hypothetical protein BV898_14660 [Hypsibius exemplaris]|uniref:Uncharacterized protein n=1 Tax=Hypsibius exemplaris TaxID=2072580 RepID=A0A9X6RJP3_HYPEX|nr:hypothetical protein BV898_14660 [Hypsibius exemplaris]